MNIDSQSVREIIDEWREILENNPDKFTEKMIISRQQIEAIVNYFNDIDSFAKELGR